MRRTPTIAAAGTAAIALLAASLAPASAAEPEEVLGGLAGVVLSAAVAEDGTVLASGNFAGLITRVSPGGEPQPFYADEDDREVGGLSVDGDVVTFAATALRGRPESRIYTLTPTEEGLVQEEVLDAWGYERTQNPDGHRVYGIRGLKRSCKRAIPRDVREAVVRYRGIKESHPYATTSIGATTYVADAAGNAIIEFDRFSVGTLAVLPPVKVKVTKELRRGMGLPRCTQGRTFRGEPVPTDVEVGPDGDLYVTTLGGVAGEVLPLGAIYRITPDGTVRKVTGGLMMPVGLAFGPDGATYVSVIGPQGGVLKDPSRFDTEVFAEVPFSGDVEVEGDHLYVTRSGYEDPEEGPHTGAVLRYPLAATD